MNRWIPKIHAIDVFIAGMIKSKCGRFLDAIDYPKHSNTDPSKVTCQNCLRVIRRRR